MVVRDVAVFPPAASGRRVRPGRSEQSADAYLTEFENTNTRFPNFKFPERHAKIARQGLRVVVFAQEKNTKKVLNAVVADVK